MELTRLELPAVYRGARHAMTSVPWPAERGDGPGLENWEWQAVPLFDTTMKPRVRRFLLLSAGEVADELKIKDGWAGASPSGCASAVGRDEATRFSNVTIRTLKENLDRHANPYVYRECEARISVAGREIGLRVGLRPNSKSDEYSWWQWCRAERNWSGAVAEAWRIGGHLVPYTVEMPGKWDNPDLTTLGGLLNEYCGDILHGDVYLIAWKTGLLQITAHFKSAYFHTFPKPVPAFPVLSIQDLRGKWSEQKIDSGNQRVGAEDLIDFSSCGMMFSDEAPGIVRPTSEGVVFQPWGDLRFLANKTREEQIIYLPPEKGDVLPAGASRSVWFNIGLDGVDTRVARYRVAPQWYRECGVIETDRVGPASELGARNAALIREETHKGGIDTGRVWRYLRRWVRLNKPQEDGAEWEGNLGQAMFTLAYQRGESPAEAWETILHESYHAADVSVYHGTWMGRLECTAAFTAPLPKFRFGGFLYGYLETGDPYLLELARSVAGVYMAMEWALQPRSAIGRDAYPLTCLMALWDHDPQPMYLDFARQMAGRLLSTQNPDGSFSAQAGAGVLTGVSCRTGPRDIHFGSGILSPIALMEWAIRDGKRPGDFLARLRKWADLMVGLQKEDGHWYVEGKSDEPYTLTGSATVFSLVKAAELLGDRKYLEPVRRYLKSMNDAGSVVLGTHSFLSAQYAHVADAVL